MSFTLKQKARFYQKLHTGLKAGVDLQVLLTGGILPPVFARQLARLTADLDRGLPLSAGLFAAKIVSQWEAKLIGFGEAAGRLEVVLADLRMYFEDRSANYQLVKGRLIYPLLVLLVAITVLPLPALVDGSLGLWPYLINSGLALGFIYLGYQVLIKKPFERASVGAFNPLLIALCKRLPRDSGLRLLFEISYLNLLTICLESGLDAASTLKLLKDSAPNKGYRLQHTQAISQVENRGRPLGEALIQNDILQHWMCKAFITSSEHSGTLHSALRTFVISKKAMLSEDLRHTIKKLSLWFYALLMLLGANLI